MRNPIRPRIAARILLCCSILSFTLPFAYGADKADKQEIVTRARQSYYSLRNRGLVEFTTSVQPNWRLVLKEQLASDPANAEKALTMLNGIHFLVSLGPDGAVKITHREDVAPVNEQAAEGFKQIFSGMEQAMSGFFDSWSPFMLTSPFPQATGEYSLEEVGDQYNLSYKEGNAAIATAMSRKDLVISEIKVDSPEFKSVVKPQFSKSAEGFLLSGYEATYQGAGGGATVQLNVRIENQPVSGLQLPHKLNLDGSYQGTPFQMELMFSGYRVKKR
ncbi:MAG TPA: hypothetical protein VNV88_09305 [Candidatus Solibacter sp.]|nr:hypothetical protein [Candidatus Solibacter sp.]